MESAISVYVEMTPNPNTMKFVASMNLLNGNESVEFLSKSEAKSHSPMAEELFNFPFVKAVFMTANFVSITKTDNVPWDFITMELREFVREWLSSGKAVISQMPDPKAKNETSTKPIVTYKPSAFDAQITQLLDDYVRPAVELDGGAIEFLGFDNGVVTVAMKGSCSGCPSSTATLKGGIENLLKTHIPEVKEVLAESL